MPSGEWVRLRKTTATAPVLASGPAAPAAASAATFRGTKPDIPGMRRAPVCVGIAVRGTGTRPRRSHHQHKAPCPARCAVLRRYGGEHKAPELQKEVVYGLTELHREAIK